MYGIYMIGAAVDAVALTPKLTEVTEPTIRLLVDAFYARVRRDPTLAPVFAAAIAADAWPVHLEKMYAFWSSVMLTSGRYKGDPVATHRKLADVAPPMFGNGSTCSRRPQPSCSSPTLPARSSRRRGASRKA